MPRRRLHRVRGGGLATECARAGNFFSRWLLAPRRLEHEGCPVIYIWWYAPGVRHISQIKTMRNPLNGLAVSIEGVCHVKRINGP